MEIIPSNDSCAYGQPGIFRGHLRFENPRLADYSWPLCEIRGRRPGPRLCISAGVHVNEVSSIEAAVRLQRMINPETIDGSVSIIPLINQPAFYKYTALICPI
ncbi:MAG: succinylglutamate desuccinylase, partial [Mesorhizobium sp.]